MKIKTAKLCDDALAYAVAMAEGWDDFEYDSDGYHCFTARNGRSDWLNFTSFKPHVNWAQGGPITEREGVWVRESATASPSVAHLVTPDKKWFAYSSRHYEGGDFSCYYGETYLVASMRCYVASRLGTEVDIPEELLS